jgi:hypothetical protein
MTRLNKITKSAIDEVYNGRINRTEFNKIVKEYGVKSTYYEDPEHILRRIRPQVEKFILRRSIDKYRQEAQTRLDHDNRQIENDRKFLSQLIKPKNQINKTKPAHQNQPSKPAHQNQTTKPTKAGAINQQEVKPKKTSSQTKKAKPLAKLPIIPPPPIEPEGVKIPDLIEKRIKTGKKKNNNATAKQRGAMKIAEFKKKKEREDREKRAATAPRVREPKKEIDYTKYEGKTLHILYELIIKYIYDDKDRKGATKKDQGTHDLYVKIPKGTKTEEVRGIINAAIDKDISSIWRIDLLCDGYDARWAVKAVSKGDNDIPADVVKELDYVKLPFEIKANKEKIETGKCVEHYFAKFEKKSTRESAYNKMMKEIKGLDKITGYELFEILERYDISYTCYNVILDEIKDFQSKRKQQKHHFILHSNHLYGSTKEEIRALKNASRESPNVNKIEYVENLNGKVMNECTEKSIEWIKMSFMLGEEGERLQITKYIDCEADTLYVNDLDLYKYHKANETILREMGREQHILYNLNTNYTTHIDIIADEKGVKTEYVHTMNDKLGSMGAIFDAGDEEEYEKCVQYDRIKAYTNEIISCEYVPVLNESTSPIKYNGEEIILTNFYRVNEVVEVPEFIRTGWISGYGLWHFRQLIKTTRSGKSCIVIDEYVKPVLVENVFRDYISRLKEHDITMCKEITSRFIGCAQVVKRQGTTYKYNCIGTSHNLDSKLYYHKIGDKYVWYEKKEYSKIFEKNLLPFAMYIIDRTRYDLFDQIEKIAEKVAGVTIDRMYIDSFRLRVDDIKKLEEIDNIVDKTKYEDELKKKYAGKTKQEVYKSNQINFSSHSDKIETYIAPIEDLNAFDNALVDCWAGCGKTHYIINTVIPELDESEISNYIVISSQHSALREYRANGKKEEIIDELEEAEKEYKAHGIKTMTIQSIMHNKISINYYTHIIIDEAGLLDYNHWNYIMTNRSNRSNLLCFGDSRQLRPVNCEGIVPLQNSLLKDKFGRKYMMETNYRNHYTVEDYKNMLNGDRSYFTRDGMLVKEYGDMNARMQYVSWFVDTRNAINKYHSRHIEMEVNGIKTQKGEIYMVISNNLKKLELYNKTLIKIVEDVQEDDKQITVMMCDFDGNTFGDQITIDKRGWKSINIEIAYCVTLYSVQGSSLNRFKIVDESIFEDPTQVYVMLSRLKTSTSRSGLEKKTEKPVKKITKKGDLDAVIEMGSNLKWKN